MRCATCGRVLPESGERFCSERCSRRRDAPTTAPFTCPECHSTVLIPRKKLRDRKFCSLSCARAAYNRAHLTGARNGRWRGGRALAYGPDWKRIKEVVRARDGVCRSCGKTPAENGRALDVHHVDPFRFSGSNDLDNLEALCRSCHMRADDHGRAGSARFLRTPAPKGPTKREIRRLQALARDAERRARRRERQREARRLEQEGLSLRQIARALGVSHQTVANWLEGKHRAGEDAIRYLVA